MATLRGLEDAAREIEEDKPVAESSLNLLMAPGSSLGGARPKASVLDPNDVLWIAKIPSINDDYDIGGFEMVAHDLAALCEIQVPEARLDHFSLYGNTYLSKRFDRVGTLRIPFESAMSLLEKSDGEDASYLDLVSFLQSHGSQTKKDLQELFRRMVFNIVIANTDDHLRNHGFLFGKKGWRLFPAYDLNPRSGKKELTLSIDGFHHDLDLGAAVHAAANFDCQESDASQIIKQIQQIVQKNFYPLADKYGISKESARRIFAFFKF